MTEQEYVRRSPLVGAIRAFTVDGPNDEPNGPTETAYAAMLQAHLDMLDVVLPLITSHPNMAAITEARSRLEKAGAAISDYGDRIADDIKELRNAAELFFPEENFRRP